MKHVYSISEMAEIHNLSRQTLIYYDRINLFKPSFQNAKGYRFYTLEQCPQLREIRLLVFLDVPLKEINDFLNHKDLSKISELFEDRLIETRKKIRHLSQTEKIIKLRLENFKKVSGEKNYGEINLNNLPKRYYTFLPYESVPNINDVSYLFRQMINSFRAMGRGNHFLNYYNELQFKHGQLLLNKESLNSDDIFTNCGAVIYSNERISHQIMKNHNLDILKKFPAGLYASTLYNGNLENSEEAVKAFLKGLHLRNLKITGDLLFSAILEQPFIFDKSRQTYELQIPCLKE